MFIDSEWLKMRGACDSQVDVFEGQWPDGGEVSEESLVAAADLGLDINWLAEKLLRYPQHAEYLRLESLAWKECQRMAVCNRALKDVLHSEYRRDVARALWSVLKNEGVGQS